MAMTRRKLIQGAAAAGCLPVLPLWAGTDLGGMRIDTLSDGHLTLPSEFLFGPMPETEVAPIRAAHGLTGDTLTSPCNVTLMRQGDRVVLFDAGAGTGFQPTMGALVDALAELGIAPEDVTHVVFTHGHPDHIWGVLDDFDDPLFADAAHLMGRAEFDYWMDPATADSIGADRQAFAVGAKRRLEALGDRMELFEDGAEILPGVAAVASFGHTPGHMSFELRDGSDSLLVLGDAIGNGHVAFARPDLPSGSDQDPDTAIATRARLFDRITAEQMQVIGFHFPDGGIGRAEARNDGYLFLPETAG